MCVKPSRKLGQASQVALEVDQPAVRLRGAVAAGPALRHAVGESQADDLPAVRLQRRVEAAAEDAAATRDCYLAARHCCRHQCVPPPSAWNEL